MDSMTKHLKEKATSPLPFKACLYSDPSPCYFDSYQRAFRWLKQHGKGEVKKKSLIEFAFPLEQKITRETWIRIREE